MAVVEALQKIPIFRNMPSDDLAPIADVCLTELYDKGDNVFRKGESGNKMFFVQKGVVDIIGIASAGTEFPLAQIETGDFFGEQGILTRERHATTTVVREDLISLVLRRQSFQDLLVECPYSALKLLKIVGAQLSTRVRHLNEQFLFARSIASTLDDVSTEGDEDRPEHPDAVEARKLEPQTVDFLSTLGEEVHLGQDEVIIPEGGKQRDFYILKKGRAVVQKKLPGGERLVLAFIGAGGIFGEMSFLDYGFRSAEVRSIGEVELCAFWGRSLDRLAHTNVQKLNKVYLEIIRHMCANYNLTGEDYLEAKYKIHVTMYPDD